MLCPKCGKAVDMTGTDWVKLQVRGPINWSPVCHRDCAVEIKRDIPALRDFVVPVPTDKKRASRIVGRIK